MEPRQLVVLLVAGAAAGCLGGTSRPVGERCGADSECGEGLVCSYGSCRAACSFDRDCPEGEICIVVSPGANHRLCPRHIEEAADIIKKANIALFQL